MKKSLIVIALIVLMIVPVFAETVTSGSAKTGEKLTASEAQKTEVEVSLDLTPRYAFGVTGGKTGEADYVKLFKDQKIVAVDDTSSTEDVLYTDLNRVTKITMTANLDAMKLEGPASGYTYYISYWFYENNTEKVSLVASLDGDLTLTEEGKSAANKNMGNEYDEKNTVIPYQVTFDNKTLNSTDKNSETVVPVKVQSQIGAVEQNDIEITVAPITTNNKDTLKDKYAGTYKSNIVLQINVGA